LWLLLITAGALLVYIGVEAATHGEAFKGSLALVVGGALFVGGGARLQRRAG
jgi:hypothetical protein